VEVFPLEAVWKKTENKREKKKKRMWLYNISVSRCNEGEFHTLFQRLGRSEASPRPDT
jgi:hypothetical protein